MARGTCKGVHMAEFIGTCFFKSGTYGWSESFYTVKDDHTAAIARMRGYKNSRRTVLNRDAFITYIRVSNIGAPNDSGVEYYAAADGRGQFGNAAEGEQPYDGLLIRLEGTPASRRMFILRGMPRGQITSEGVYEPTDAFRNRMANFIGQVRGFLEFGEAEDPLRIRRRVGGDRYGISALTVVVGNNRAINVTAEGALWPPDAGASIRVTQVESMARVNRIWRVRAVATQSITTFPRRTRVIGTYEGGGLVTIMSTSLVNITGGTPQRGVRRDTGRPSDSPRGRRSRANL